MEWYLTECDINKDIKVSDSFHYSGTKSQVKHLDHLFNLYIKSMGKDTVFRIEERKHPAAAGNKFPIEVINDIFNPVEGIEKHLSEIDKKLDAIITRISATKTDSSVLKELL